MAGVESRTLLLVEDDPVVRAFLSDNLVADGFEVLATDSLRDAVRALELRQPDLAIVDIGLPDGSGLDLVSHIRSSGGLGSRIDPALPLVLLTGRAGELDRLRGFERGCDDYVAKPFAYGELRLRIQAILRRSRGRPNTGLVRLGELEVDPLAREVRFAGLLHPRARRRGARPSRTRAGTTKDSHAGVDVELGSKANPPGFDEQLLGLEVGGVKSFPVRYPADHPIGELADTQVSYTVSVKGLKRRVVPELDDEFAKDMGEFDSLEALRTRVRDDLEHEARHASERELRGELMKQLAARVPFEVPASLIDREVDRRLEEFARRLVEQNVDPRQAGIDWQAFRDSQREAAREAVASAMALDEIARREQLDVTEAEAEQEIGRYAERTGRTRGGGAGGAREGRRSFAGVLGIAAGEVD